jgi:hypothetical protein
MIHLYLKTHNITGLKYLGKTSAKNPHTYQGSGKYWKNHINKHGYDVNTEILASSERPSEIRKLGLEFSEKLDIVKSNEFANLKVESGDGGWDHINTNQKFYNKKRVKTISEYDEETKLEISKKRSQPGASNGMFGRDRAGENNPRFGCVVSEETKLKISEANTGKVASEETRGKMQEIGKARWSNLELREQRSREWKEKGIKPPSPKGMLWWNDGVIVTRAKECPGETFKRGRLL